MLTLQVSVIRKEVDGDSVTEWPTPGVLNCAEMLPFWVSWAAGRIHVGAGTTVGDVTFLRYADPTPYQVNGLSVATGGGSTGLWEFGHQSGGWRAIIQ